LKLLAFSDFHGSRIVVETASQVAQKESPDLVVVAGDIAHDDFEMARGLLEILTISKVPVLFVPGNMDSPVLARGVNLRSAQCIHGECIYCGDMAFIGLGGATIGPFIAPFEYEESEAASILEKALRSFGGGRLVLVSHCPPKNTKVDLTRFKTHIGSTSVRRFIEQTNPVLAICGHVHEAAGLDRVGSTVVVNPGVGAAGFFAIVKLDREVNVKLSSFEIP